MTRAYYSEISFDASTVEMLDGFAFRWFDFQQLAATAAKEYLIYIPDIASELDIFFYGRSFASRGSNVKLEVFANPTFSSEGVAMPDRVFNRNADFSAKVPASQFWEDPTITADGTLVDYDETAGSVSESSGVKGSAGSDASQEFPRVMPKDTYLLVRITNFSTANPANYVYKLYWSEVPVKG